ncbi:hypothetical protein GX586_07470 [bacterium]|nr:hypothetical protein [bacterium]
MMPKHHIPYHARPRGAALLLVLALVTMAACVAAVFIAFVTTQSTHSATAHELMTHDVLARAAEEEIRAWLSCGVEGGMGGGWVSRRVSGGNGGNGGDYAWRIADESLKQFATAPTGMLYRSLAEAGIPPLGTRMTSYGVQPVVVRRGDALAAQAALNVPDAALREALGHAYAWPSPQALNTFLARLSDTIDSDSAITEIDGAQGAEGIVPLVVQAAPAQAVAPFGSLGTQQCVQVGRLLRGWSGWNSAMHFYPDRVRDDDGRRSVDLVLQKQYGRSSVERQYQNLLNTYDPAWLSEFGVSNMWRGTVIHALLAVNTCASGGEEWLIVEDNYVEDGRMVFRCAPLCDTLLSTQFIDKASGELCQYGLHGWARKDDPIMPGDLKDGAEFGYLAAPASSDAAVTSRARAKPYVCDAMIIRGLRHGARYRVELLADVAAGDGGVIEVLENGEYRPVSIRKGRAVLYDGVPQRPLTASAAFGGEGYLLVAFRTPDDGVRRGLYGAVVAETDGAGGLPHEASEWHVSSLQPLDARGWSLEAAGADGVTQTLWRIVRGRDGRAPFLRPREHVRFVSARPAAFLPPPEPDVRDVLVDTFHPVESLDIGTLDKLAGMQRVEINLAGSALRPGALAGRTIELWPDRTGASVPSVPFTVVTNTARSVTISIPRLSAETIAYLRSCRWLEEMETALPAPGTLRLRDADGGTVAALPFGAADSAGTAGKAFHEEPRTGWWMPADERDAAFIAGRRAAAVPVFNRPLGSTADAYAFAAAAIGRDGGGVALRLLDHAHVNWARCAPRPEDVRGALRLAAGTAVITDKGLNDYANAWADDEWRGWYAAVASRSTDLYRISGNCEHCITLDAEGFPSGAAGPAAQGANGGAASVRYAIVTAGGSPVVYAQEQGTGEIIIHAPETMGAPVRVAMRVGMPRGCRVRLGIAGASLMDPAPAEARDVHADTAANNSRRFSAETLSPDAARSGPGHCPASMADVSGGLWLSPPVRLEPGRSRIVVRAEVIGRPRSLLHLTDIAVVADAVRVNAININDASPEQIAARLRWPEETARALCRRRPVTSLGDLRGIPGITDGMLLAAAEHILLRSDRWSAEIATTVNGGRARRVVWFAREPLSGPPGRYAPVTAVERRFISSAAQ